MDSLLELLFVLALRAAAAGVFLLALFLVVRAAVEAGIRRSLPDAALRPSLRQLLREDDVP